jgi:hypothetical protein
MPRRKLARRFEPRWGVTRPMLEVEARYVAKECEDYARRSTNELRDNLATIAETRHHAEIRLRQYLDALPERDRIALQYLIARDAYHLLELYVTYVRQSFPERMPVTAVEGSVRDETADTGPFSEFLFD